TCFCATLDREALAKQVLEATGEDGFFAAHIASRPHLFSGVPVFLPRADLDAMLAIVRAIEAAARHPGYMEAVLGRAAEIARHDFGPAGAFMSYDFHLDEGPPRLIEVNTNAGGALLNAFAARAQLACCDLVEPLKAGLQIAGFDAAVIAMFESEWRRQRGTGRPRRIAIVNNVPHEQYLYPEFMLARRLFEAYGIPVVIADPAELTRQGGQLYARGEPVDLVYNCLVDFAFDKARHRTLREAYLAGEVVITPNPRHHALLANKRNLTLLSDLAVLEAWGLPPEMREALSTIPRTVLVGRGNAEALWANRKKLFFKPVSGHGGKAVYRGDKFTRAVWAEILASDYVAQNLVRPAERLVIVDGIAVPRKTDVRLYSYDGNLLLTAARLFQGQTTNFCTPGGGFAPVFFV
ncbi:MAG: hypothetical protein ACLFWF_13985, partial [Alphaproteobacteria bacterium]